MQRMLKFDENYKQHKESLLRMKQARSAMPELSKLTSVLLMDFDEYEVFKFCGDGIEAMKSIYKFNDLLTDLYDALYASKKQGFEPEYNLCLIDIDSSPYMLFYKQYEQPDDYLYELDSYLQKQQITNYKHISVDEFCWLMRKKYYYTQAEQDFILDAVRYGATLALHDHKESIKPTWITEQCFIDDIEYLGYEAMKSRSV